MTATLGNTGDDKAQADTKTVTPKPPAKGKAEWFVPRGIAWADKDGVTVRVRAGAEVEHGIIPADLITEYADRGDIIKVDDANTGGN